MLSNCDAGEDSCEFLGLQEDQASQGKIEENRTTEEEMIGWHHRLNAHEFEQTLGDSEGQGSLAHCSPQDHKESDTI